MQLIKAGLSKGKKKQAWLNNKEEMLLEARKQP